MRERKCLTCSKPILKKLERVNFDIGDFLTKEDVQRLTNFEIRNAKYLYEITDNNWELINKHDDKRDHYYGNSWGREYMEGQHFSQKLFEKDGQEYWTEPSMQTDNGSEVTKVKFKKSKYLTFASVWQGEYDHKGYSPIKLPDGNRSFRFCKQNCVLIYATHFAKLVEKNQQAARPGENNA